MPGGIMGRQGVNTFIIVGGRLSGHFYTRSYNFHQFQSLVEGISIVIGRGIFMLTCNTRRFMANNYFLFAGIAYVFIGGLDRVHALTCEGVGGFHGYGANPSTRLWIAVRYTESISLALPPPVFKTKIAEVKPENITVIRKE